jgi:hypothetical protein
MARKSWLKSYTAAQLCAVASIAFLATPFTPEVAHATIACVPAAVAENGGTLANPEQIAPTDRCGTEEIDGNFTPPTFWEFSSLGGNLQIMASLDTGAFNGTLDLIDPANDDILASANFSGDPSDATLNDVIAAGNYIVGIEPIFTEPPGSLDFNLPLFAPLPLAAVPEPASLAIFGAGRRAPPR